MRAESVDLHLQSWPAQGSPRGSALLLHGLGEHAGRQQVLAQWLTAAGLQVLAPDLPGHGRSPGRRGDAAGRTSLVASLRPLWEALPETAPRLLVGHSLGGLLATALAAELPDPPHAMVLSSPFFAVGTAPKAWQRAAARVLLKLAPALGLPTGLDAQALSHDPAVVAAYRADPLVHDRLSARFYAAITATQARLPELARALSAVPVLLWHGSADRLTSHGATQQLAAQFRAAGSTFLSVPGGFHELYHDTPAATATVRAALEDFLGAVLPR